MFAALSSGGKQIQMEFTPPPFEESAEKGIPSVPKNLGWSELDAKVFKASICGAVCVREQKAEVWFTNPSENSVWLKLRVFDEKNSIIGETGIIRPGEYVKNVSLNEKVFEGMPIVLKIMSYEPETYCSEGAVSLGTKIKKVS